MKIYRAKDGRYIATQCSKSAFCYEVGNSHLEAIVACLKGIEVNKKLK